MTSESHEQNVRLTYLALRFGMVLLVALLLASIATQFVTTGCLQRSISAYYYTPTRPLFVAMLTAIGACLIIYRGNTDPENVLLDFAGFLAFVVALVPTGVDNTCESTNLPTLAEITLATRNNVSMLLLIAIVATYIGWRAAKRQSSQPTTLSQGGRRSAIVSFVALGLGVLFFALWPDAFQKVGHTAAAVSMFAAIIAVVVINARGFASEGGGTTVGPVPVNRYYIVAVAMGISLAMVPLAAVVIDNFDHYVFVIEAALIIEFAVFWALQTAELGGKVTRSGGS